MGTIDYSIRYRIILRLFKDLWDRGTSGAVLGYFFLNGCGGLPSNFDLLADWRGRIGGAVPDWRGRAGLAGPCSGIFS